MLALPFTVIIIRTTMQHHLAAVQGLKSKLMRKASECAVTGLTERFQVHVAVCSPLEASLNVNFLYSSLSPFLMHAIHSTLTVLVLFLKLERTVVVSDSLAAFLLSDLETERPSSELIDSTSIRPVAARISSKSRGANMRYTPRVN